MIATLTRIQRHPIKTLGHEVLDRVSLQAGRRIPGDREWAVLTEAGERHAQISQSDGQPDRWLPKSCFLRGVSAPPLQAVRGGWRGQKIALTHPERPDLTFDPQLEEERLVEWLGPLWPAKAPRPTRLIKGAAIWTDSKWPWISILSQDSLTELEQKTGKKLGTDRWRGNLWIEGLQPFQERELVGQVIRIGETELRVTDHIGRCAATNVDTTTGAPDIDMVDMLAQLYGHTDFGIFAEVVTGGTITVGDEVAQ
ncbi:MOSC domain-containing protein [Paracoccus sp. Z330]|uniref:MOSC domain-containing protein n=1 Tax=Paracoccus onchidii TaxID=3017813 RepID=A0ABT4ZB65_9RHOB|nr:MOSC domain-containing protein [Paracoccus onchidii]MDB6175981.1 MOSC domain-containing protein [Paracoccus onchidii]